MRVADPVGLDQLQAGAVDGAGALDVGRGGEGVAADQGGHQGERLELVVVEGCLGIALARVVGPQSPLAFELGVEPLALFLGDAERLPVDLRAADQAGADHAGAVAHDGGAGQQVVAHGVAGAGHQHAALWAGQVAARAADARHPAGHAAQYAGGAAPACLDAAATALGAGAHLLAGELDRVGQQPFFWGFAEQAHCQILR